MNPPGTKDPKEQGDAAKSQPPTKPGDPVNPCLSCTVSIDPKPVSICEKKNKKDVKAAGTPSGGSFTWKMDDEAVAKVQGSGKNIKVEGQKDGKTKLKLTYKVSGCTCEDEVDVKVCTCTPAPNDGRHYAHGFKNAANVIGVRASIKTRYGKVCCEDEACTTVDAYNVVYANVSNETGTRMWAQTGFGRERFDGTATPKKYRYGEMQGTLYKVKYDTDNPPSEGSTHKYQVVMDNSTGKWTYTQDGTDWLTFADNGWKKKVGTVVHYVGEIINQEDDMAGTAADKCGLTECQYLPKGPDPVEEETLSEVLSDFGFDKSDITEAHQAQLDSIAASVAESWKNPPEVIKIRLVGHTDTVGSAGYNVGLGQRRALAARTALVEALDKKEPGLSAKVKLVTESKGESEPVDKSGTPGGDARNRRVEVFLTTKPAATDWQDAGMEKAEVRSDDDSEWGAEWISGTALNIWDKKPRD